jgi:hypothetical protein
MKQVLSDWDDDKRLFSFDIGTNREEFVNTLQVFSLFYLTTKREYQLRIGSITYIRGNISVPLVCQEGWLFWYY